MMKYTIPWEYDKEQVIPDDILELADKKLKLVIGGQAGFSYQLKLWKKLNSLPKPYPPCVKYIPALHGYWNRGESLTDMSSKLIDGQKNQIRPPKAYSNPNSVCSGFTINMAIVVVH